jgi:hypothetical protein
MRVVTRHYDPVSVVWKNTFGLWSEFSIELWLYLTMLPRAPRAVPGCVCLLLISHSEGDVCVHEGEGNRRLGKNCRVLSFAICTAHKNVIGEKLHSAEFRDLYCSQTFWGGQIKEGAVGKECGASGGEVHTGFWCGNLTEIVHLVHLGVDGRTILK